MMEARLLNGREGVIVKEKNDGNVTEEKLAFTNLPKEKLLFLQKEFPTNYPFLTRRPSFLKTVFRSSHRSCSVKKDAFRNSRKFTGKHLCKSLFFNKVIKKETLVQVFSCEFCGISKNTNFTEHLRATASKYFVKRVRRNEENLQDGEIRMQSERSPKHFFNIPYANYRKGNFLFMFDEIIQK